MPFIFDHFRKKPFKPLYNLLVPRSIRKQWQYQYDEIPRQQQMADFWQQTISAYQQGQVPRYDLPIKRPDLVGQDIIWQYWGQGLDQLPEVARLCFASVDKFAGKYQVIRLTDENFRNYFELPSFIELKKIQNVFEVAHFSDLLRIILLKYYGGIWLDASILLLDKIPKALLQEDFFIYSRYSESSNRSWGDGHNHFYFNWSNEHNVNHLNSIIIAKPNLPDMQLLMDLLMYYWQTQTNYLHYFFSQILMNEVFEKNMNSHLNGRTDDTYPHLLVGELNKEFNQSKLTAIKELSVMQKLSVYSNYKRKTIKNKMTNYGYLVEEFDNAK